VDRALGQAAAEGRFGEHDLDTTLAQSTSGWADLGGEVPQ
jgi:hypothetical protein